MTKCSGCGTETVPVISGEPLCQRCEASARTTDRLRAIMDRTEKELEERRLERERSEGQI